MSKVSVKYHQLRNTTGVTKLHQLPISRFQHFVRTDTQTYRQTPSKTIPARSTRAGKHSGSQWGACACRHEARVRRQLMVELRVTKLVYAASSWWGFAAADDRKRLQAVIRCGIRSGLCEQHHKTVEELVEEADDKLFTNVKCNKQHVLHSTSPGTMDTKYHLTPRPHNFNLTAKYTPSSITECDFFTRMLLKTYIGLFYLSN